MGMLVLRPASVREFVQAYGRIVTPAVLVVFALVGLAVASLGR